MFVVRIGRPVFLGDSFLSLLFGALGALPVVVVLVATGYPEWGETLLSFMVIFAFFYLMALAARLIFHVMYSWIDADRAPSESQDPEFPRSVYFPATRLPLRVTAGGAGAALVLSLTYLFGTGDAFPG